MRDAPVYTNPYTRGHLWLGPTPDGRYDMWVNMGYRSWVFITGPGQAVAISPGGLANGSYPEGSLHPEDIWQSARIPLTRAEGLGLVRIGMRRLARKEAAS